jgi:protoheme IX farnesyltransferase
MNGSDSPDRPPSAGWLSTLWSGAPSRRFAAFSAGVLAYTVLVILFGAFVSSSLSGDGCGVSWPTCHGSLLPDGSAKSAIEYTHRLTSGLLGPMVLVMIGWVWRLFPRGLGARSAAVWLALITVLEAALGAKLVLNGWVAGDDSMQRVAMSGLHLANTFVLLSSATMLVYFGFGGRAIRWRGSSALHLAAWSILAGLMALGVTGAITSMGDLIYPKEFRLDRAIESLPASAHFLERMRQAHPFAAMGIGLLVAALARFASARTGSAAVARASRLLQAGYLVQLGIGLVSLATSAHIAMQMIHLLAADAMWITAVLLGALSLQALQAPSAEKAPALAEAGADARPQGAFLQRLRDYAALTKPRVVSLLLFTTVAAMFVAAKGMPDPLLILAVSLGGYMASGSANAINMVLERDLDQAMERTRKRPTLSRISSGHALAFAGAMSLGSFLILASAANLLTALLAQAGLLFYVVVYTILLKRRTPQNIVIGGAAGSFPPLVGWAAVTGQLNLFAWVLFGIIFLWTPVHFWALAFLIKDDYAKAGVPMMPVVAGERATVIQIIVYAFLTSLICIVPFLQKEVSWIYVAGSGLLNAVLVAKSLALLKGADAPRARSLFRFSMLYLALMFIVIAADQMAPISRILGVSPA